MNALLKNKNILVTGAAGLLGTQLCQAILGQGGKVIAADLTFDKNDFFSQKNQAEYNGKLETVKTDVTQPHEVEALFGQIDSIDGAVNCSYPRNKSYGQHFFDVTMESFNDNLAQNLGSAFLFMQQSAKYFKKSTQPFSLVNISSIYGVVAPKFEVYENTQMTMPVEYAAIKAALQHLSRYAAAYVNDSEFRVNCICPGGIFDNQSQSFLTAYKQQTNGKGMLDVNDVTGSIIFLLSDLSSYVTGQNIVVDDGFCL